MICLDDLLKPTWQCVHFSHLDLSLVSELRSRGIAVLEANVESVATGVDLFNVLAKAMQFPTYYGKNWDAVDECLRDLDWLPATGYVLLLHHSQYLWRQVPRDAGMLIESWLFAAEEWGQQDVPFHLVFFFDYQNLLTG